MKLKGSLIGFALITCLYLGLLIWLDARKQVFTHLPQLWQPLLAMIGMALASFMLRFARWQWLLSRLGHRPPLMYSFLAYLSGFVFTATPGKVGELVRIRYLSPAGAPPKDTIGVFVFERLFDLLAVLILAAFHTDLTFWQLRSSLSFLWPASSFYARRTRHFWTRSSTLFVGCMLPSPHTGYRHFVTVCSTVGS